MGDAPARTENPAVTTGPIRGSKKIHVGPLKVAMREIYLEPSSGEPPVRVYDTSGPYTDPQAQIDITTTLGAVVGTHAGPGTVGFFWFEDIAG